MDRLTAQRPLFVVISLRVLYGSLCAPRHLPLTIRVKIEEISSSLRVQAITVPLIDHLHGFLLRVGVLRKGVCPILVEIKEGLGQPPWAILGPKVHSASGAGFHDHIMSQAQTNLESWRGALGLCPPRASAFRALDPQHAELADQAAENDSAVAVHHLAFQSLSNSATTPKAVKST